MSMDRKEYLRLRRETLLALCAAQRSEVAYNGRDLQQSLHWVDRALSLARSAPVLPAFVVAASLLMLRAPRHRLLLWSGRLITGWKLIRLLRAQRGAG
jgi:hypothetical protein